VLQDLLCRSNDVLVPQWVNADHVLCGPAGALPAFESDDKTFGTMAAAPFGSSLILPISYAYIALMGSEGLTEVCVPTPNSVWLLQTAPDRLCPLAVPTRHSEFLTATRRV
jgi:hypothetical protein